MFFGWVLVIGVAVTLFFVYGIPYSYGVFFNYIARDLGLGRAVASSIFSINIFVFFLSAGISGSLADRYGHGKVMALGTTLLVAGLSLLTLASSLSYVILYYGFVAGLGLGMINSSSYPTLSRLFVEKRGLAQGIGASGAGLGVLLLPRVAESIITTSSWRYSYLALGLIAAAPLYMNAYLMHRRLKMDYNREGVGGVARSFGLPLRVALKKRTFWILSAFYVGIGSALGTTLVHLIPFSEDIGIARAAAITSLSVAGGASVAGRIALGWVSDLIGRRAGLALCCLLMGSTFIWLLFAESSWMVMLFGLVFGLSWGGSVALVPAASADFFGSRYVNSIYGALSLAWGVGSAAAPYIAGLLFDFSNTYYAVFLTQALVIISLTLLMPLLRKEF